jgi:quercetin dioxygenase-like cupin family protein
MPEPVLLPAGAGEAITREPGREVTIKAAVGQVTVTESRYAAGERGPDPHVHWRHIDAFFILDGEMAYLFGRENLTMVAGAGTFVLIPAGVVHTFGNESEAEVRWLNIHAPDGGFADFLRGDPSGFDSEDPPPDRGRPADDALVSGAADGERFERADRIVTIRGAVPEVSAIEIEFEPGFTVDPHRHADHTDAFYVLEGEVEFTIGDDVVRAGPGTFLAAPSGARHGFRNGGSGPARVLNLHAPDAGFAASVRGG